MSEEQSRPETFYCEAHQQTAKWVCGVCGKPVCKMCRPRGFNYQVYHPACVDKARAKVDQHDSYSKEVEAPSIGVKLFAWLYTIGGMMLLGLGLFFIIFSITGEQVPIRAMFTTAVSPTIDSIPGARSALTWLGVISLVLSVVMIIIGIGLLNCVAAIRRVLLVLCWLDITISTGAWIVIAFTGKGFWMIPIISIASIWFFSQRKVQQQFEQVL